MSQHLVLHGVAVKKHADARAIAEFAGLSGETTAKLLADCVKSGRVVEAQGKYLLAPLARVALEGQYAAQYASLRANASFLAAYEAFERLNVHLKALITDWQTLVVGGSRVANDHSDKDYDLRVIDRLGELHERAEPILAQLTKEVPRFGYYAAAFNTVAAYALLLVLAWFQSRPYMELRLPWGELGKIVAACAGTVAVVFVAFEWLVPRLNRLQMVWLLLAEVVVGVAVYAALLVAFRAVRPEERAFAVEIARRGLRRVGLAE